MQIRLLLLLFTVARVVAVNRRKPKNIICFSCHNVRMGGAVGVGDYFCPIAAGVIYSRWAP